MGAGLEELRAEQRLQVVADLDRDLRRHRGKCRHDVLYYPATQSASDSIYARVQIADVKG